MPITVTNRQPTTFDGMLDSWVEAEVASRLSKMAFQDRTLLLARETVQRFADGQPTPWDRQVARGALFHGRGAMVLPFLSRPSEWFEAVMNTDGLVDVSAAMYFRAKGYVTLGDLTDRHPGMHIEGFDPALSRGRPILVSVDGNAPWYLIEGAHRCCEIIRRRRDGRYGETLEVLVGVCPRAREMVQIGPA